jgi:hypothetical protein
MVKALGWSGKSKKKTGECNPSVHSGIAKLILQLYLLAGMGLRLIDFYVCFSRNRAFFLSFSLLFFFCLNPYHAFRKRLVRMRLKTHLQPHGD